MEKFQTQDTKQVNSTPHCTMLSTKFWFVFARFSIVDWKWDLKMLCTKQLHGKMLYLVVEMKKSLFFLSLSTISCVLPVAGCITQTNGPTLFCTHTHTNRIYAILVFSLNRWKSHARTILLWKVKQLNNLYRKILNKKTFVEGLNGSFEDFVNTGEFHLNFLWRKLIIRSIFCSEFSESSAK